MILHVVAANDTTSITVRSRISEQFGIYKRSLEIKHATTPHIAAKCAHRHGVCCLLVHILAIDIGKFISVTLGARTNVDKQTCAVRVKGTHTVKELADLVQDFIEIFVLCGSEKCRLVPSVCTFMMS